MTRVYAPLINTTKDLFMAALVVKNGFISHSISQVAGGIPAMACLSVLLVTAYLQISALHEDKAHGQWPLTEQLSIFDSCTIHTIYLKHQSDMDQIS